MADGALAIEVHGVTQHAGTVTAVTPEGIRVRAADGRESVACRAVSCLVVPEPGDRVLVATGVGVRHVLAVLERTGGAAVTLGVEGDLRLQARDGTVTVAGQRGVELVSPAEVSVHGHAVTVRAHQGTVAVGMLTYVGERMKAEIDRVKLYATRWDGVFDRVVHRARSVYRTVDEVDQVRAGTMDYTAKGAMSLHAANAVVTAENLVKVDGDQIHMG